MYNKKTKIKITLGHSRLVLTFMITLLMYKILFKRIPLMFGTIGRFWVIYVVLSICSDFSNEHIFLLAYNELFINDLRNKT